MTTHEQATAERFPFLTEADIDAITLERLDRLTPGFQEMKWFKRLARLGGLDTVEVLPVRTSPEDGKNTEILLARRPMDDHFWPGLLHVVGSVIREDDPITHEHDYDAALARAMEEVGGVSFTHDPIEIETVHRRVHRSREVTIRFWGEVAGETEQGGFYDAADVLRRSPELGIMDSHAAFIERVANAYESTRQQLS